jgi:hypothetical protein
MISKVKPSLRRSYPLIALCLALPLCAVAAAADRSWIERSDKNSAIVFEALGAFEPEWMSYLGVERFDPEVIDLKAGHVQRFDAAAVGVLERLSALRKTEPDPAVQQDLDILVDALGRTRRTRALEDRLLLPYFDCPGMCSKGSRLSSMRATRTPGGEPRSSACSATPGFLPARCPSPSWRAHA